MDEDTFLKNLLPRLHVGDSVRVPPGDDCAALALPGCEELVLVAADQLAAGVHYDDSLTAAQVGRKLLARNLSDIAAMGGTPRYALMVLAMPTDVDEAWLQAMVGGVIELAEDVGVEIVGGDICAAGAAVSSLTIIGTVSESSVCRRDRAGEGDRVFVTGSFGGSLKSGKHWRFTPRLEEGRFAAGQGFANAMIDVSDGLLVDLSRLAGQSSVEAKIDVGRIPCVAIDGVTVEIGAALLDGEDYELIIAVPADRAGELEEQWPFDTPLTDVGELTAAAGPGGTVRDLKGQDLRQLYPDSFRHFGGDGF